VVLRPQIQVDSLEVFGLEVAEPVNAKYRV
jgi:hypothetical protein